MELIFKGKDPKDSSLHRSSVACHDFGHDRVKEISFYCSAALTRFEITGKSTNSCHENKR